VPFRWVPLIAANNARHRVDKDTNMSDGLEEKRELVLTTFKITCAEDSQQNRLHGLATCAAGRQVCMTGDCSCEAKYATSRRVSACVAKICMLNPHKYSLEPCSCTLFKYMFHFSRLEMTSAKSHTNAPGPVGNPATLISFTVVYCDI
jgi:hypothetical protein